MSQHQPNCRNCRIAMDEGWVADRGHANALQQSKWIDGEPEMQRWLGITWGPTVKGHKELKVTVWRCSKCGLLESYAL